MSGPLIHAQVSLALRGDLVVEAIISGVKVIIVIEIGFDKGVKEVDDGKISAYICVRVYSVYDYLHG